MMTHRANGVHDAVCAFRVCVFSLSRKATLIALKYSESRVSFPKREKVLTEKTLEREEKKERFFFGV